MLPNPLVVRTLAEYKRRIFGQYKASDTAGKVFLGNFLGAQSLLGLQRAYNQLMKDGRYIVCHFFFPLRVGTFFGWVWHKLLETPCFPSGRVGSRQETTYTKSSFHLNLPPWLPVTLATQRRLEVSKNQWCMCSSNQSYVNDVIIRAAIEAHSER